MTRLNIQKSNAIEAENFRLADQLKSQIEGLQEDLTNADPAVVLANKAMYDDISEVLSAFEDDALKVLFGDHVTVTIYKDRIETEEYDHE